MQGEDLLDAHVVVGVDDGRDVKVCRACPAVEGDLAQHAGDVFGALGDRVPVADPAGGEGLVGGLETLDLELGDGFETGVLSEVDGAGGGVLVDEVD